MPNYNIQLGQMPDFVGAWQQGTQFGQRQNMLAQHQAAQQQLAASMSGYQPGQPLPPEAMSAMATIAPGQMPNIAVQQTQLAEAERARQEAQRLKTAQTAAIAGGDFAPLQEEAPMQAFELRQKIDINDRQQLLDGALMARHGIEYMTNVPYEQRDPQRMSAIAQVMADSPEEAHRYLSSPLGHQVLLQKMQDAYMQGIPALAQSGMMPTPGAPASTYGKTIADLNQQLDAGEITPDQHRQAVGNLIENLGQAGGVQVTIGEKGAVEEATAVRQQIKTDYDGRKAAPKVLRGLDDALDILKEGNVYTGMWAEGRADIVAGAKLLGLDINEQKIVNTEKLRAILMGQVLGAADQMTGVLSDTDIKLLKDTVGDPNVQPDTLVYLLNNMRRDLVDSVSKHNDVVQGSAISKDFKNRFTIELPAKRTTDTPAKAETKEELPAPAGYEVGTTATQDGMTMEVIEYNGQKVWMRR